MKIYKAYDVLIIGGGAAGVAAGVAASESGSSVAIIERNSELGGKATSAFVGTICGSYYRSSNNLAKYIAQGFPQEFIEKLKLNSQSDIEKNKSGLQYLPYDQIEFSKLCDHYIRKHNIDVYLQSDVYQAEQEGNEIKALQVLSYNDPIRLNGKSYIDCSGDAVMATLLGLDVIRSDQYQAASKVFSIEGITDIDTEQLKLLIFRTIKRAIAEHRIINDFTQISIVPGSHKNNRVFLKIGIPITIDNEINRMTQINMLSRKLIAQVSTLLIDEISCLSHAHIGVVTPEVGIRTGKRHLGQYKLTKADVLTCKKDDNSVARGSWPIEYWSNEASPRMEFFPENDYYDIPADCLMSNQIDNLFFAGRNISAENDAIASARVIGTCLQTGYAAGILASGQSQEKDIMVSIKSIKDNFGI